MSLIPATILTGFLGAGKTTLLNRLLHEQHGQRIAVIENEFGEENIDNEILVQETREQIIEMSNGCICCTVRGDLISALSQLAQKQRNGELTFDRVVIETTGLANPGPVAQTFFMDEEKTASEIGRGFDQAQMEQALAKVKQTLQIDAGDQKTRENQTDLDKLLGKLFGR